MDMIFATYMAMFAVFLGADIGLFDKSSSNDEELPPDPVEPTDPNGPDHPLYIPDDYTNEIQGTEGDDDLSAEEESDLAWFLNGGDDHLDASAGADYAEGGAGDDTINMREGDDIVLGGDGNDVIDTGTGFDLGYGGAGNDQIDGNGGQDTLLGDAGDDTLEGGSGADLLYGGDGDDYLSGLATGLSTSDSMTTIDGVDSLFGGAGHDTLLLGAGDIGHGGEGDDIFQIDHTRDDLSNVSHVNDFGTGDTVELHYTGMVDANGAAIVPTITVEPNAAGTSGLIMFNGQPVAEVAGGQALTPDMIRLVVK